MIKSIAERTSYRGKYTDDKVSRDDLIDIVNADMAAPSGCNKQTTSFIIVDDDSLLEKLKQTIDPPIATTAPAFILVLTQRIPAYRDKYFNIQDYSAAIENMLLEIVSLGYESCWYEGHITDDDDIGGNLAKVVGIPADYKVVCVLPVGKAAEEIKHIRKKPFEERVWFNGFKND